jgi:16S rRNA (uracil1498-N3)-methyltransferase
MRCFVQPSEWDRANVALSPEESHHLLHVLRAGIGARVEIFNGRGGVGAAEVTAVKPPQATLRVVERSQEAAPAVRVILVQALLREQKMDLVIQKATELGAAAVAPVLTEHSVVRLKPGQLAEKRERWERIVLSAAKQSGVAWLPAVETPRSLADFLASPPACDLLLVGALDAPARPLREVIGEAGARKPQAVAVLVGPEGDFSPAEMAAVRAAGATAVGFGGSVLRSETAAIFALSVLRYEWM